LFEHLKLGTAANHQIQAVKCHCDLQQVEMDPNSADLAQKTDVQRKQHLVIV